MRMKRNWYAAIILLALCVLLFRAGQYVDRTTAGMQRQLEAAYALAEQGDYPAARRASSHAANRVLCCFFKKSQKEEKNIIFNTNAP